MGSKPQQSVLAQGVDVPAITEQWRQQNKRHNLPRKARLAEEDHQSLLSWDGETKIEKTYRARERSESKWERETKRDWERRREIERDGRDREINRCGEIERLRAIKRHHERDCERERESGIPDFGKLCLGESPSVGFPYLRNPCFRNPWLRNPWFRNSHLRNFSRIQAPLRLPPIIASVCPLWLSVCLPVSLSLSLYPSVYLPLFLSPLSCLCLCSSVSRTLCVHMFISIYLSIFLSHPFRLPISVSPHVPLFFSLSLSLSLVIFWLPLNPYICVLVIHICIQGVALRMNLKCDLEGLFFWKFDSFCGCKGKGAKKIDPF